MGSAIKGVVFLLSGALAGVAAAGPRGKTIGRIGVIKWMDQLSSRPVLIVLILYIYIGTGLTGYVVLRFM